MCLKGDMDEQNKPFFHNTLSYKKSVNTEISLNLTFAEVTFLRNLDTANIRTHTLGLNLGKFCFPSLFAFFTCFLFQNSQNREYQDYE